MRSKQCWIQNVNSICSHNYFNIFCRFKSIQLIKQFKHCSLNFRISSMTALNS
uniref:Candidate secreted effector n=1 Tax=Meloidogyne incognita TaxID=6306 RepID=A0A914M9E8_MELIC